MSSTPPPDAAGAIQAWTPEPWTYNGVSHDGCAHNVTACSNPREMAVRVLVNHDCWSKVPGVQERMSANFARIVACVNAMAGVADPARELARLREEHALMFAEREALDALIALRGDVIAALTTERDRLRAVVERLPMSADGVPITPGMKLWTPHDFGFVVTAIGHTAVETMGNGRIWYDARAIYSTREAAAAALSPGGAGEGGT